MDGVGAVAGLHVWSDMPVGTVGLRKGISSAYPDLFELTIRGQEAHAAFPQRGVDAISLAAQVIMALQTVVSRRLDPTRGKVLTVGTIQGGTKDNILAGQVRMTGTIRTFEPEIREALFAEMEAACGVARALGGDFELNIVPGYIPVVNDSALTDLVRDVAVDMLGQDAIVDAALEMGGEDFSYFAREAPGCFFLLGSTTPGQPKRLAHHPHFDIDERALPLGAALLAGVAQRWLREAGA
jgi:amidohydrolase